MEEVEKVNQNLVETGIAPLMSAATLANHRRTYAANVAGEGVVPPLDEALRILTDDVVKPER
jgi:hypothetical protein